MQFQRTLSLAVLFTALASSGCLSPWLKRATDAPEPKPAETLVAGFVVHFDDGSKDKSLLDAAVDAAQNAGLDDFGKKATGLLATALSERGYTAKYDGPRAGKLDAVQLSSNSATAALTGQWRHPDSSYWVPQTVDSLFVKPADIIGKLRTDEANEYFAFTDISIRDGGIFMKEPWVVVRTTVYDRDARKVLDLNAIGQGSSTFMFSDRSPANLEKAMTAAFASLENVGEQPL